MELRTACARNSETWYGAFNGCVASCTPSRYARVSGHAVVLAARSWFRAAAELATYWDQVEAQTAARRSWQEPHAKVLPTGDLEWAPKPFEFKTGASIRYIDFESGNDANDGLTAATPIWVMYAVTPIAALGVSVGMYFSFLPSRSVPTGLYL